MRSAPRPRLRLHLGRGGVRERATGSAARRRSLRPRLRWSEGRRKARGGGGGSRARGGGGRPGLRPSERRAEGEGARKEASAAATPGAGRPLSPALAGLPPPSQPAAQPESRAAAEAGARRPAWGERGREPRPGRRSSAGRGGLVPAGAGEGREGAERPSAEETGLPGAGVEEGPLRTPSTVAGPDRGWSGGSFSEPATEEGEGGTRGAGALFRGG